MKFTLGIVVTTPGALSEFTQEELTQCLNRHSNGDWGDLCKLDKKVNNDALLNNDDRLFSAYDFKSENGTIRKLWIITEYDRSVTTFLLPEEY